MSDNINFQAAVFLASAPGLAECPPDEGAEVAFAGRSNAGKSSAINTLTRQGKLARTSKTPGRTQLINFFTLNEQHRLVDLPGYGFAKVPKAVKERWQKHLSEYMRERRSLRGLVLLMDIRHPLREYDTTLLNWAIEADMPVHLVLTKADKLKKGPAQNTLLQVRKSLGEANVGDLVTAQCFSALKGTGVEQLQEVLRGWLNSESVRAEAPASPDEES